MTIRVGVADDQALVRDGLGVQLDLAPDLELVGVAADGEQAVELARAKRPDVLLMDVRMPVLDGIAATRRIVADPSCAGVRVLVLTTFDVDEHVYDALRAGASGFLLKDATPEELVQAVRVVASGEALLAPRVTSRLVRELVRRPPATPRVAGRLDELTPREREVLVLVGGRPVQRRDRRAGWWSARPRPRPTSAGSSPSSEARDRAQLVVLAYEAGLVTPGGSRLAASPRRRGRSACRGRHGRRTGRAGAGCAGELRRRSPMTPPAPPPTRRPPTPGRHEVPEASRRREAAVVQRVREHGRDAQPALPAHRRRAGRARLPRRACSGWSCCRWCWRCCSRRCCGRPCASCAGAARRRRSPRSACCWWRCCCSAASSAASRRR